MILLKIILSLFIVLNFFVAQHLYKDLKNLKKSKGYENTTLLERFKVRFIFYFILICQISLAVILGYFVIIPMTLGW